MGVVAVALLVAVIVATAVGAVPLKDTAKGLENEWLVGHASESILPQVNGRRDYFIPVDPSNPNNSFNPGTFVPAFDDGEIIIGNGRDAVWVLDDIRTSQLCVQSPTSDEILVIVNTDTYMLFAPDLADYKSAVLAALGQPLFDRLHFLTTATHSHSAPDTSGLSGLNRNWYADLLAQLAAATTACVRSMQPATITVADSKWRFGQGDNRDPNLFDPNLNVLQATATSTGAVIATLVQYSQHVETGLFFDPQPSAADCAAAGQPHPCNSYSRDRVIFADYPGHLATVLSSLTGGGGVVYLNGGIGTQIGINRAPVWDANETFPIDGDGSVPPAGAPLLPYSYYMTYVLGREMAHQVMRSLQSDRATTMPTTEGFTVTYGAGKLHMINVLFRAGMAPHPVVPGRPLLLGYEMRVLYNCDANGQNCVSDNFETVELDIGLGVPVRKGDWADMDVMHVRLPENVQFVSIPGEMEPAITNGVPADFDTEYLKYYDWPTSHVLGENYTLPGVVKEMMKCKYCFTVGAALDHGGYIFPIADWRMPCRSAAAYCRYDATKNYWYLTGVQCKLAIDAGIETEEWRECMIGQTGQAEAPEHYEEINSIGWDAAEDYITVLSQLLGVPAQGRYTRDDFSVLP